MDYTSQETAQQIKIPELRDLQRQASEMESALQGLVAGALAAKKHLQEAAVPLTGTMLPALDEAASASRVTAYRLGALIGRVTAMHTGQQALTQEVKKTAAATGSWLKRSLASFDQINRLQKQTGSGAKSSQKEEKALQQAADDALKTAQAAGLAVSTVVTDLGKVNFDPAVQSLTGLDGAARLVGQTLGSALNGLIPLSRELTDGTLPAMNLAAAASNGFGMAVSRLLTDMAPVSEGVSALGQQVEESCRGISRESRLTGEAFAALGTGVGGVCQGLKPQLSAMEGDVATAFRGMGDAALWGMEQAVAAGSGLMASLSGMLGENWNQVWRQMQSTTKQSGNGIIGVMNGLIGGVSAGMNSLFGSLNGFQIKIPDWVPFLGGQKFSFNLKTITAREIPLLAQGAVLPANKPFLAVVGDQKHGTNIEAPLATIQEAVALTMEDMAAQNAAGQEATVAVLSQILQAVLGISIGDDRLAAAVDRQHAREAVMRGGTVWN